MLLNIRDLPNVEKIDEIITDFPSGRLKKDDILSFPPISHSANRVRFHEVKLTNYNKSFEDLLSLSKVKS